MAPSKNAAARLFDELLLNAGGTGDLAGVAREKRLCIGYQPVAVSRLDLCALALTELAMKRDRSITMLYPVPAGEAAVLLAAQVLVHALVHELPVQAVGLVTADPHLAEKTWNELNLVSPGNRAYLRDAFPAWRAAPDGSSPVGRRFRGVMIGRRSGDWRVRTTIIESLSGPVESIGGNPAIRLLADPMSPLLYEAESRGELVWGWDERVLKAFDDESSPDPSPRAEFSTVAQRVRTMTQGIAFRAVVCRHPEAEKRLADLRDDLRTLSSVVGNLDRVHLYAGLRAAWAHATTLASLPCTPSQYDEFSGVPPLAARPTRSFVKEISAWAETLPKDASEYAHVVASDLGDLRAALDKDNPFVREIAKITDTDSPTLVVVRTRTAARALGDAHGSTDFTIGAARISWLSQLHREGSWPRVVCVGPPPRSAWHRLESGLGRELSVLVIGEDEKTRLAHALSFLRNQRRKWAAPELRSNVWVALTGKPAPPQPELDGPTAPDWVEVVGNGYLKEPDPFSPIEDLMVDDRPLWDGEAHGWRVAIETELGDWRGAAYAVRVVSDGGTILLETDKEIEIRVMDRLDSVAAADLKCGDALLLGRRQGRLNLIESLQETLEKTRPDLLAADLLMKDYKVRVVAAFLLGGSDIAQLVSRMRALGCRKDDQTIRSWVLFAGPMGPRDFPDHVMLNEALNLALSRQRLEEVFASITRIRTFRRKAGRVLARAATAATAAGSVDDDSLTEFGLTAADLRDAIIEVTVISVEVLPEPVPVTALNTLIPESHES